MNSVFPDSLVLTRILAQYGLGQESVSITQRIIWIAVILLVAYVADLLCRKVIVPAIIKVVAATKVKWDDYLFSQNVLDNICHIVPSIVIYILLPFAFYDVPSWLYFLMKISQIYIIAATLKLICAFLSALYELSNLREGLRDRPMRGVFQMLKIITVFLGSIGIVSVLIDKSPLTLFAGLGAAATILMLVFKDTIVGLVAGVQLSANDMLRPGDWIKMDKSGADGVVTEITLTTIKVRNWDNTITTIPPYTLVSDSFQNWRGMQESDGRRIKRSLCIDMRSVRFCTPEELQGYAAEGWLTPDEAVPDTVNLGVFRRFMEAYLRRRAGINTEMTLMVRQLQPTAQGLPIELYCFSADKNWIPYETLQADLFDYVLAILPRFGLRVFQSPSGNDFNVKQEVAEQDGINKP